MTAPHWARQSDKRGRKALMALGVAGFMASVAVRADPGPGYRVM